MPDTPGILELTDSLSVIVRAVAQRDRDSLRTALRFWPYKNRVRLIVTTSDATDGATIGAMLADVTPDRTTRALYASVGRVWSESVALWLADALCAKVEQWQRQAR